MKTGVMMFPTDKAIQPIELARACEERGFGCLWFPEHSHIPASRETPWGGRAGAPPLPEEYWRSIDLFVALAAAAAVTTNLELGSGICLAAQRDPLWMAKEVALARPPLQRPLHVRRRLRLEQGGDGEPQARLPRPPVR